MPSFGYLWLKLEKMYSNILNQQSEACQNAKIWAKQNKINLVNDQKCLTWLFAGLDFKKLSSYLKLATSNFLKINFQLIQWILA